ncbi:UNVERIFIED_CONTAM: Eukaryotic translation initiation factor 3 subunit L [Sesamum latifolium]|uniref:Eukaryotic translation initiation factor 3 subunit L n=1 Tax=Sesamum latifolium TaxID=2727402 RepID=A0AAW2SP82_9LAMI
MQVVLHGVVNMQLPNQWLWDMVDEFVYQFQSFCQYRAKMKNKTEQEIALLRQYDQDAYRLQLKLFLYEVKQQQLLSGVRTYLKVYSTISLGKLAAYMEVDEPTLRTILMTYKHKTHSVDSDGKITSNADIDYYIDDLEGVMTDIDRIKLE